MFALFLEPILSHFFKKPPSTKSAKTDATWDAQLKETTELSNRCGAALEAVGGLLKAGLPISNYSALHVGDPILMDLMDAEYLSAIRTIVPKLAQCQNMGRAISENQPSIRAAWESASLHQ